MNFKTLNISFAEHILEQLQGYCDKTGQKPTDVIRQALFEFLNNLTPYIVSQYNTTVPAYDEKE